MPKRKVKVRSAVKLDAYRVVDDATERGVDWGWHRAHKYTDRPDEMVIKQSIQDEVLSALCEVLKFDD